MWLKKSTQKWMRKMKVMRHETTQIRLHATERWSAAWRQSARGLRKRISSQLSAEEEDVLGESLGRGTVWRMIEIQVE